MSFTGLYLQLNLNNYVEHIAGRAGKLGAGNVGVSIPYSPVTILVKFGVWN